MPLTNQLELLVTVAPRLTDQVRLDVEVFRNRVVSPLLLTVAITPKVTDSVLLLANIVDQDFEAAAQAKVLAPVADVEFLE